MINVAKSQPAPISLAAEKQKKSGTYRTEEVLERLAQDFHAKCYICEDNEPTSINVEHFRPHEGNLDLKFDWNNLFFACGHCNNIKLDKFKKLIDCTSCTPPVLNQIRFWINPYPFEKAEITAINESEEVDETINLLLAVYNGTSTDIKRMESHSLREKLLREIRDFQKLLQDFAKVTASQEDKDDVKRHIRQSLSVKAPFTAFKVWVILNNDRLKQEFGQYISPEIYQV